MSKFAQFLLIMNIFFGLFVNFPSELSCLISALKKKKNSKQQENKREMIYLHYSGNQLLL